VTPCNSCLRPIAGTTDDPKTCIVDEFDGPIVLCGSCFHSDLRRVDWTRWDDVHDVDARPMFHDEDPLESAQVGP